MQLFYGHNIGDRVQLTEDDSKHAIKVLRKGVGDILHVFDGKGNLFEGPIVEGHQRHCSITIQIHHENWNLPEYEFHLAIAPTKQMDRLEWLLEKAVEIGITKVTPILCEHSERKVLKPERLERILLSASKQSLKGVLPELAPLTPFAEFVKNNKDLPVYIGYCGEAEKHLLLDQLQEKGSSSCVMIGPEGDFSPFEVELALEQGCVPVTMGNQRLRTETAGLVAVHTAHVSHLLQS